MILVEHFSQNGPLYYQANNIPVKVYSYTIQLTCFPLENKYEIQICLIHWIGQNTGS